MVASDFVGVELLFVASWYHPTNCKRKKTNKQTKSNPKKIIFIFFLFVPTDFFFLLCLIKCEFGSEIQKSVSNNNKIKLSHL